VKILTLHQPFATLMALDAKRFETRGWRTGYRGPLAIHAAQGLPEQYRALVATEPFKSVLAAHGYYAAQVDLPRGAIVCVVDVVEIVSIEAVSPSMVHRRCYSWMSADGSITIDPARHEHAFGDFSDGRFAWLTRGVRRLPRPVPCRGYQGLRDLPPEVEREVLAQLGDGR